jgi:hypothetical protein
LRDLKALIMKVDALITDLSKPQTRQATATKAKGKKRVYYEIHSDSDDEDDHDQVVLPTNPTDYIAWIANRHAAWDTSTLTHEEDLTEKYRLPDDVDLDQTKWPSAMKSLGVTALRVTEDIAKHPWGKPTFALRNTLKMAPGYTKDSMFSDAARKALHRLEQWYFRQTDADRKALSSKDVAQWPMTTKGRQAMANVLAELKATKTTHPDFIS